MFILSVLSTDNTSVPGPPTAGAMGQAASHHMFLRDLLSRGFGGGCGGSREERYEAWQGPLEVAETHPHKGTWSVKLGSELFPMEARDLGFRNPIPVHQCPTGLPGVVVGGVNFRAGSPF